MKEDTGSNTEEDAAKYERERALAAGEDEGYEYEPLKRERADGDV